MNYHQNIQFLLMFKVAVLKVIRLSSEIIIQTMGVRPDTKIKIMSKIILVLLRLGMNRYDYITVINVVVRSVKLAIIFFFFY